VYGHERTTSERWGVITGRAITFLDRDNAPLDVRILVEFLFRKVEAREHDDTDPRAIALPATLTATLAIALS